MLFPLTVAQLKALEWKNSPPMRNFQATHPLSHVSNLVPRTLSAPSVVKSERGKCVTLLAAALPRHPCARGGWKQAHDSAVRRVKGPTSAAATDQTEAVRGLSPSTPKDCECRDLNKQSIRSASEVRTALGAWLNVHPCLLCPPPRALTGRF